MKNKKKSEKLQDKALVKVETAEAKREAKPANEAHSNEGKSEEVDYQYSRLLQLSLR